MVWISLISVDPEKSLRKNKNAKSVEQNFITNSRQVSVVSSFMYFQSIFG